MFHYTTYTMGLGKHIKNIGKSIGKAYHHVKKSIGKITSNKTVRKVVKGAAIVGAVALAGYGAHKAKEKWDTREPLAQRVAREGHEMASNIQEELYDRLTPDTKRSLRDAKNIAKAAGGAVDSGLNAVESVKQSKEVIKDKLTAVKDMTLGVAGEKKGQLARELLDVKRHLKELKQSPDSTRGEIVAMERKLNRLRDQTKKAAISLQNQDNGVDSSGGGVTDGIMSLINGGYSLFGW